MKKGIVTLLLVFGVLSVLPAQSLKNKTVYIAVRSTNLKSSTGFFARTTGTASYGDTFKVLQEKGKWVEVQSSSNSSLKGWVATTNVTTKRITSSSSSVSASADELALAGKGFSAEVEKEYRSAESLNYDAIDRMEVPVVSNEDVYSFLVEGHLATAEE
ncbi:SH3 domain-containing protein [Breznakiella homolactica]|uniref:SH3 domain-containing protein n=1 Tax=Breznakiella homolactica TaxID=2798577 RepID=A0A7T8BBM5_9SPIR|nr:SH3 domain-containing protein [Breznakiella homolactica]QQO10220.1 SH3 domain-containing protein [Breznakiella homolactica]